LFYKQNHNIVKRQFRFSGELGLLSAMLLAVALPISSLADFAPEFFPIGSQIHYVITSGDQGDIFENSSSINIVSSTLSTLYFPGIYSNSYTNTGPNTGKLSYNSMAAPYTDYFYSEGGTIQLTFTTPTNGNFTAIEYWYATPKMGYAQSGTNQNSGTFSFSSLSLNILSLKAPGKAGTTNTFISTDTITVTAATSPVAAGAAIKWTVVGLGVTATGAGFPQTITNNTDNTGVSTFTFRPADNPQFVGDRNIYWATLGSKKENDPIAFDIIAEWDYNDQAIQAKLSNAGLGSLSQDETDTLRQEYVDYQMANVPARTNVVATQTTDDGQKLNNGNYNVQLSLDLPDNYKEILNAYRGSIATNNGQPILVPLQAKIEISSSFRSPQHNKAIGSVSTNSPHCYGRALDLVPIPIPVLVNGNPTMLDLHKFWYPALNAAANSLIGNKAFPEAGANTNILIGNTNEDHIHVQWTN
jgi:hypothetical protein